MDEEAYFSKFNIARCNLNSWEENIIEIENIYKEFLALNITTIPASRIKKYLDSFHSIYECSIGKQRFNQNIAYMMLNAIVEFHQFKTIFKAIKNDSSNRWEKRLSQLVGGSACAVDEKKHSSPRDFQFETFVGAVFKLSGFDVAFDEPDIVVSDNAQCIGIAAKRLRSLKRLEKNCKKASQQIINSGRPGLIAIDISHAIKPGCCINTNDLEGARHMIENIANNFILNHYSKLMSICKNKNILGIMVHALMPVLNYGGNPGPQLATAIRWAIMPCFTDECEGYEWAVNLSKQCEIGLFGARFNKNG